MVKVIVKTAGLLGLFVFRDLVTVAIAFSFLG
jgi:hypothetical protein